jgi:putative ABC transport system permease protein
MSRLRIFFSKLLAIFGNKRRDAELETELQSHIALLTEENLRKGMSLEEARHAAYREFGGIEQTKELYRDQRSLPLLPSVAQDVRYGLRLLAKTPGLFVVIIAILAVGIGSSTAIYSLIDACLLRSNTYPVVDRWEVVRAYSQRQKSFINYLSTPEILEVKQLTDVFEAVGAIHGDRFNLSRGEFPERIAGTFVTANAITMTQVAPFLGRTFREDEDRPGAAPVAVLSYELWQRRFSADPNVIGQTIRLNDVAHTIIGVMPAHYGLWSGEVWVPLQLDPANQDRSDRRNWIVAVLKKGITEKQAEARLKTLMAQMQTRFGTKVPEYADWNLTVWNINEAVIGGVKPALLLLAGAVGLLVLVACANVAILLMSLSTSRMREVGIRIALGAGSRRIIRQMLTESVLLSLIAGVIGVCIAIGTLPLLVHMIPSEWLPTTPDQVHVNFTALSVACSVAALMGILFGMAPALQLLRQNFAESLKEGSAKISGDRQGRFTRNIFVAAEIALSLVILTGSALMLQSYRRLEHIELGFHPDHLLTFEMSLDPQKYSREDQIRGFFQRALQDMESLPGVESAATVSGLPMGDRSVDLASRDFTIEGRPTEDAHASESANFRIVSPDYFQTMGVRVLQGRGFSAQDDPSAPRSVIINEAMAQQYWPAGDALGHRILPGREYGRREDYANVAPDNRPLTVIGVVSNVKQTRVIEAPVMPEFYLPLGQQTNPPRGVSILVRSKRNPADLTAVVRGAIRTIDPQQPISVANTMDQVVADSFGPKRLTLFLLAFLAGVVLVLATVGLYAALAYSVSQRRHEIGIRMALGADRSAIGRMIVSSGASLAVSGVVIGLAASLALTRLMQGMLYGISATDPATLAGAAVALASLALLASYIPARRATRVDPLVALRHE